MSHYAANFLIYAATGLNFRTELRALIRRSCPSLVTCLCRATGTENGNTTAAAMLELRQTNATSVYNGNVSRRVSERLGVVEI